MDGSRFDGLVRMLAAGQTRRRTLQGLAGGVVAGLLGQAGLEEAGAACVKPGTKGCKGPKNGKCCTGSRCQGGTKNKEGRCKCKGSLKQCGSECVNTKNDKKHCGKCNNRCTGPRTCVGGKCQSVLGCRAGDNFCNEDEFPTCPESDNPTCSCITDVHGNPRCVSLLGGGCSDCESNADCGEGFVCFNAAGCDCDEDPGSNGNGCIPSTCDGIQGSGGVSAAGWRPFRRP